MSERAEYVRIMASRVHNGIASYGCSVSYGDVDLTDEVRAAVDRHGPVSASTRAVIRDYAFRAAEGGEPRDDTGTLVEAYAAVWGPVRELDQKTGQWVWRSLSRDSFHLGIDPVNVDLRVDHDGPILGEFLAIEPDDYGLRTLARYDDSPAAQRALADIRSGRIAHYSVRVGHAASPRNETRNGEPMFDVVTAVLFDAGPASRDPRTDEGPADTRAVILSVGGAPVDGRSANLEGATLGELLEEIADYLGTTPQKMRDHARDEELRQQELAEASASRVWWLLKDLRAAREGLEVDWFEHSRATTTRRGELYQRTISPHEDEADAIEQELRQYLTDAELRQYCGQYGVPRKIPLQQRMLGEVLGRNQRGRG